MNGKQAHKVTCPIESLVCVTIGFVVADIKGYHTGNQATDDFALSLE